MPLIRASPVSRALFPQRASLLRATPVPLRQSRPYAASSYGGGEGDPKGEKPQDQGPNAAETHDKEHPGPAPSGSSPKGSTESPTGGSTGNADSKARGPKDGASPKILDSSPPAVESEDVKKHNEEFENRHDRANNKINPDGKDNVGKGFWSGQGGANRES